MTDDDEDTRRLRAITLLSLRQVAGATGYAEDTIDGWVRASTFPRPLVAKPGSPRRWRLRDVEAWIEKRRHARDSKPTRRGQLKEGRSFPRYRPKFGGR